MESLKQSGTFALSANARGFMRATGFSAGRADEAEVAETLRKQVSESGYRLDPHTATGVHVQRKLLTGDAAGIVLATAHPAKFPDAVEAATAMRPSLPAWLSDLMERPEFFSRLPNDQKMVEEFIREKRRVM
jgi:threonine synthase